MDNLSQLQLKAAAFDLIVKMLETEAIPISSYNIVIHSPTEVQDYFRNNSLIVGEEVYRVPGKDWIKEIQVRQL